MNPTGWCGVAAVIAANVVSFCYIRMAWTEESDDPASTTASAPIGDKKVQKID